MKEQVGHHTVYRTNQQDTASSQHVAHTTRATRQRTPTPDEGIPSSPHRAGFTAGLHPECTPYTSSEQSTRPPTSPTTQRSVAVEDAETLDDGAFYPQRRPTSVRRYWPVEEQGQPLQEKATIRMVQPTTSQTVVRYHQRIPARSSRTTSTPEQQYRVPVPQTTPTTRSPTVPQAHPVQKRQRIHWLVYVGVIVLVAVGLYVGSSIVVTWWHLHQDDVTYGRPRTYQCDARVGHHDMHIPSHFIALNLNKQIEIIEFPGGDATKAQVYIGPTLIGDGQELTPVTLSFRDVNGDGKPDMILHIGDSQLVYINDNGTFRPAKASDHITM